MASGPGCHILGSQRRHVRNTHRRAARPWALPRYTSLQYSKGSVVGVLLAFDNAKQERGLTAEMVESVDSCDQLDGVVELYTECVSPELEGLKKDANTKKRRIRNAAPSRRPHVVEEYVRAKEVYERAAADARTASWKRFCSTQDRESMWDGVYRVIRDTGGSREDVLLRDDSGRVCNPDESAALLAETFFPGDQVDTDGPHHAEIRRRTDGIGCPPEALDVLSGVDPPFTGAELKIVLRAFNPKKAPGIDGFTSDICQAAILRDPGLFLAVANKCLRLGYFPTGVEGGGHKGDTEARQG
ncbi:Putative 115 kDa protein in type-1 retrotransposable element R1DM [Eumeta japonica]|uniref:115 kDa protein in type-1 retrotransposable element R1DM n=1 Tax=Eumeta variegata TaxID=151549 RepID=A0A4C1ZW22_EUMVA|nr:Putative 115 kDa protein in type-1 retrotransposable element R1DM [Eumeta japonica]